MQSWLQPFEFKKMPKVRRVRSPSIDPSRSCPYPSSKNVELHSAGSDEDIKEWEEARCPICMEAPHNAVLLKCSSHEMGCRPFMCNTSYRHSNCLDQFCKSFAPHLSTAILQEIPLTSTAYRRSWEVQSEDGNPSQCGSQLEPKLMCPLCRGEIYGYMVLEPARRYMNSKPRSCSSETCEFQGAYSELRKHARSEHPSVRPSEVDPSRQQDWMRMEQERDLEDFLSTIQVSSGEEYDGDDFEGGLISFMSLLFVGIFHSIDEANRMSRVLDSSRQRLPLPDRRSGTVLRTSDDVRTNRSARWRRNLSSMHSMETYNTGRWRSNSSPVEPNFTARWRRGMPSSRSRRDLNQYYREATPGVGSSSMRTPSWRNISSARNPRAQTQRLRWRDHRWSAGNYLQ